MSVRICVHACSMYILCLFCACELHLHTHYTRIHLFLKLRLWSHLLILTNTLLNLTDSLLFIVKDQCTKICKTGSKCQINLTFGLQNLRRLTAETCFSGLHVGKPAWGLFGDLVMIVSFMLLLCFKPASRQELYQPTAWSA